MPNKNDDAKKTAERRRISVQRAPTVPDPHRGRNSPTPIAATMTDEALARVLFDAYSVAAGGLTDDGKPIPPFDAVGPRVTANWLATARAGRLALAVPPPPSVGTS